MRMLENEGFAAEGYRFDPAGSADGKLLFLRDEQ